MKTQVHVRSRRLKELRDGAFLTEFGKAFQQLTWRAAIENARALILRWGLKILKSPLVWESVLKLMILLSTAVQPREILNN